MIECLLSPFNSHKWPRQDSPYNINKNNIKQTSDKNREKYSLGNYYMNQYQLLQTKIMSRVWQTGGKIPYGSDSQGLIMILIIYTFPVTSK